MQSFGKNEKFIEHILKLLDIVLKLLEHILKLLDKTSVLLSENSSPPWCPKLVMGLDTQ